MALVHSSVTVVKLGSNDISSYVKSSDITFEADVHDVTTYGTTSKVYKAGLTDATISLEGWFDTAATGPRKLIQPLIGNGTVVFTRQLEGTGTGKSQDVATVIVKSFNESAPVADIVTWKAELQVTGGVNSTAQT